MSSTTDIKSGLPEKDASIGRALKQMKGNRPLRAEETCRDYLHQHPGCTDHMRLLGHALMKQRRLAEAEEQFRFALSLKPDFPQLHEDLGSALALQSRFEEAIPAFERAIQLQPALPLVQKKLGQALAAAGRGDDADKAFREYFDKDPDRAAIVAGVDQLRAGQREEAIEVFLNVLKSNPDNVNAMRHLAVAYWQEKKKLGDAEALLRRATQLASDYTGAWLTLGSLLLDTGKHMDAIEVFKKTTKLEPENAESWGGLANAYGRAMYPEKAVEAFKRSIELNPNVPRVHSSYGHELKTIGDQEGALREFRTAIGARPGFGEVYWTMANLKIFKFEDDEVKTMLQQIERDDLTESEDIHFRFALGKAMEDKKDYDQAWHYYHTGNERQRMTVEHEPIEMEIRHKEIRKVFTREIFQEREGQGFEAPDPIFIVGLPRSGSTLVEQILASHSQVEGTSELPELGKIAESIGRYRTDGVRYPNALTELRDKDIRAYGKEYIEASQRHRQADKPFFTDKLPNNFPLVGFAHLILPNAKVINARRHPFDSCLGGYKQLFGRGQNFTYGMLELAHYYQQYDAMIKHWHEVLPGKVLDVHYEETVTDLEGQVRRILEHCELPFEESCVRFHETERAVKTASSEQVRQPIYTGAMGKWRRYEKHLGLWVEQLGYIVDELPEVSKNAGL
jgi:tetratricopeptide (TPR) repeat protein